MDGFLNPCINVAVIFRHSYLLFSPDERLCYVFSTQNNYCEFFAYYDVVIQNVILSNLKMPACGASLSSYQIHVFSQSIHYPFFKIQVSGASRYASICYFQSSRYKL